MLTPKPESSTLGKELPPPTPLPLSSAGSRQEEFLTSSVPGPPSSTTHTMGILMATPVGKQSPGSPPCGAAPHRHPSMQLNVVPSEQRGVRGKVGALPLTCEAPGERGDDLLAVMLLEHVCAYVRIEDHLHSEKPPWRPGPLGETTPPDQLSITRFGDLFGDPISQAADRERLFDLCY